MKKDFEPTLSVGIGGVVFFLRLLNERAGHLILHPLAVPRRAQDHVQLHGLHRALVRRQQLVHAELQDLAQLGGERGRHRMSQETLRFTGAHRPAARRRQPGPGPAARSGPPRWRCWWGAAWTQLENTWFPPQCLWPGGEPLSRAYTTRTGVKTDPN